MENPSTYGDFQFIILTPIEYNDAVRFVEPGLMNAFHKSRVNWDLSDISTFVQSNLMTMVMIWQESRYAGFFVIRHRYHGFPNRHYIEVIVVDSEKWVAEESLEIVHPIVDWLKQWAQEFHAVGVYLRTPRQGFIRRLQPTGFRPVETMLMLEL